MRETFIFFGVLVLFVNFSFAQSKLGRGKTKIVAAPCKLTEAPGLRGFYLGQTVDQISIIDKDFREAYEIGRNDSATEFPLTDWNTQIDPAVTSEIDLVYLHSASAFGVDSDRKLLKSPDYEDVNVIWWFKGGRLFGYGIYYNEFEIDQDAAKFVEQVTAKTTLPRNGWKVISQGLEAELRCNGFKVFLNAGYRNVPHLIITDTRTEAEIVRLAKEITLRKKKDAEEQLRGEREKRTTFKP